MWFDKTAITNIFAINNPIHKYRVTYDSLNQEFIVNREENNDPKIYFRMHERSLQYYDQAEDFSFVTTVADNKKHYSKQHIKSAERAEELYGTFTYPSVA